VVLDLQNTKSTTHHTDSARQHTPRGVQPSKHGAAAGDHSMTGCVFTHSSTGQKFWLELPGICYVLLGSGFCAKHTAATQDYEKPLSHRLQ
jgi:hypothetical protein